MHRAAAHFCPTAIFYNAIVKLIDDLLSVVDASDWVAPQHTLALASLLKDALPSANRSLTLGLEAKRGNVASASARYV